MYQRLSGGIHPNKNLDAWFGVSIELVSPVRSGKPYACPMLGATGVSEVPFLVLDPTYVGEKQ
jgi:hypothetical protein